MTWRLDGQWWIGADGTRLFAIGGGGSGGGKTRTTVTNVIPAKTAEEITLIGKQNEILDIQISELKRQNEVLTRIFPEQERLLQAQTQAAIATTEFQREQAIFQREQIPVARRAAELQEQLTMKALAELEGTPQEQEIRRLSNERALAILRGEAPPLLPGQRERIEEVFGRAGEEAQAGLRTFGEELATSRGLRITDTPIGGEVLRQGRELASSLAAAKARAELDVGQTELQFGEAVRQFQENLRQQAFQNRLALTGRGPVGGTGLPIMNPIFAGTTSSSALAGADALLARLSAERLGQPTQTSRGILPGREFSAVGAGTGALGGAATGAYLGSYFGPWGTAIGAVGGGIIGAAGGGFGGSSARLKKGIRPYDPDEYDRALAKIRDTPITRYHYRWEPEHARLHTGPILELAPEDIREDALRINLLDYSGLLHAGLKAVDRRITRVEAHLPVAAFSRGLPILARAA